MSVLNIYRGTTRYTETEIWGGRPKGKRMYQLKCYMKESEGVRVQSKESMYRYNRNVFQLYVIVRPVPLQ